MNIKIQKLKMFKKLGAVLIENGQKFLKKAFNVKSKMVEGSKIKSFLGSLGFQPHKIYLADRKYYLSDWQTMREIIIYDFVDRKKYLTDRYDCDNFSDTFASHLAEIYGLNSIAKAKRIQMIDAKTGKHKAWHRANVILVLNGAELKAYLFEPQTDRVIDIKPDRRYILGDTEYLLGDLEIN